MGVKLRAWLIPVSAEQSRRDGVPAQFLDAWTATVREWDWQSPATRERNVSTIQNHYHVDQEVAAGLPPGLARDWCKRGSPRAGHVDRGQARSHPFRGRSPLRRLGLATAWYRIVAKTSAGVQGSIVIVVDGKAVFTELCELVDPAHTALLLIDMQRDFVEPDGVFATLGVDVSMYSESRPVLAGLLQDARRAAVLVIHIQNTALPDRLSDLPAQIRFNLRMHAEHRANGAPLRYTAPGTPGHDFVAELAPLPDELIVPKYRSSAFFGTNLDMLLRSNGIKTVVIGGCTTEGCVEFDCP